MSAPLRWGINGYPSKEHLTESEERAVLRSGPPFEWFYPWAVGGEVRTDQPNRQPYGVVHLYLDAEGNPHRDIQTFYSPEDARVALDVLYAAHPDYCRCMAVFYWAPEYVNYGVEFLGGAK